MKTAAQPKYQMPSARSAERGEIDAPAKTAASLMSRKTCSLVWAVTLLVSLLLTACVDESSRLMQQGSLLLNSVSAGQQPLTHSEIGAGLKEALKVGSTRVVDRLGLPDGFNLDPAIHIPLPGKLQDAQSSLVKFGMGDLFYDLELRLNRAAEKAAPKARDLFWQSIAAMTFDDVMTIFRGGDDAATRYFESKMTPALSKAMRPVISSSLAEVGAIASYERVLGKYRSLPFVPDVRADLSSYVVDRSMAGIFHYLAREERAIRNDPLKRSSELLRRVFGST